MLGSIVEGAVGAIGSRKAGKKAKRDQELYEKKGGLILQNFMSTWKGSAPSGYEDFDQFFRGGEGELGFYPGIKRDTWLQRNALSEMVKQDMKAGELYKLSKMDKGKQEQYLSKKWGGDIKLDEQYKGGRLKYSRGPAEEEFGTFASLDEIRAKGGTPSIEQQYMPWIKSGENALTAYEKAMSGDLSGFKTSPYYEFQQQEAKKAFERQSNAGVPTVQAKKGLLDWSNKLATRELDTYMGRNLGLAQMGYGALGDLKSLEAYYMGSGANMGLGIAGQGLAMDNYQGQLLQKGHEMGGSAIGSGLNMAMGGVSGGMGIGGGPGGFKGAMQGMGFSSYS